MTELPEVRDAYALLSKETLELSDEEIELICTDLRKRRERFLAGQKDNLPKVKAEPKTDEEKKALQQSILGDLDGLL